MTFLETIARGGGGGSGSGGGGGGEILALVTYFPSNWLAKIVKKLFPRPTAMAITIVSASAATLAVWFVLPALGYSGIGFYLALCLMIGIWSGWYAAMFDFWAKMGRRLKKADTDLATALQSDSSWDEASLRQHVAQVFTQFQADWSAGDTSKFTTYMTPAYAYHMYLVMCALSEMNRQNRMDNLQIIQMDFSAINDHADDRLDSFSIFIEAKASDALIDMTTNTTLHTDTSSFIEEWTFMRADDTWQLAGIRQTTANPGAVETSLVGFATIHDMFYSLDWGWLLLPQRGYFMRQGRFGQSDINNHVIGMYDDHLIQLYTYSSWPSNSDKNKTFLVGQLNLPKSYGGILIRRKKGIWSEVTFGGPKGYQRYQFEWPDFNKRYRVDATDADRLATFELLNPGFMAYLYDAFEDINIEVVDSVVYFYVEQSYSGSVDYDKLLTVLTRAHKELKL